MSATAARVVAGSARPLSQGSWFWGNTDDVLFRLITVGSADMRALAELKMLIR